MKEYVQNMEEYVKNMKKDVENMKEYEETCQYIEFGTPISIMGLGTWKNSEFSTFIWALRLGNVPRPSFLLGSGTQQNFKLCLYIGLYRL